MIGLVEIGNVTKINVIIRTIATLKRGGFVTFKCDVFASLICILPLYV